MKQKNIVLMVVAVGCGLVAAVLTAQMSAKPPEQVDVLVVAKDLPVGTLFTKEDLTREGGPVKIAKRPKDGLAPDAILNVEDLAGKSLSRPLRAEETISVKDLRTGNITLPDGYDMASLQIGAAQSAAGFVGPGSRVNVNATLRLNNKLEAFPLLVNMLVVAVDTKTAYDKETNGTFPTMNTVSFAVTEKQALLLSLAKSRGCTIELLLRHPNKSSEADKAYNIDEVIKLLSDDKDTARIAGAVSNTNKDNPVATDPPAEPVKAAEPPTKVEPPVAPPEPRVTVAPPPRETVVMVKILVAKRDIAPNTQVTKDLIADDFEVKALPKEFASNAMGDLTEALDHYLKTGVAQGQWVTPSMVGLQGGKTRPPEEFVPKPSAESAAKRKVHDVTIITANGATVIRYEEVAPGDWRKVAELTPEQAHRDAPSRPDAPKAEKHAD